VCTVSVSAIRDALPLRGDDGGDVPGCHAVEVQVQMLSGCLDRRPLRRLDGLYGYRCEQGGRCALPDKERP
jgi:hypothetical protein